MKGDVSIMTGLLFSLILLMISLNLNIIYSNFKLLIKIDDLTKAGGSAFVKNKVD